MENEDEILPPDPEAWLEMKKQRQIEREQNQRLIKDEYIQDIYNDMRRANSNGYLSYRDMVPIIKELFDEEEREVLKILL